MLDVFEHEGGRRIYRHRPGSGLGVGALPGMDGSGGYGGSWTPDTRNVAVGSLDVLGIDIVFSHNWIADGLLPLPNVDCTSPPGNCWVDRTTMRMEPQQF